MRRRRKLNILPDLRQPRFSVRQCKLLWLAREHGRSTAELAKENQISERYCRHLIQQGSDWAAQDKVPEFTTFRPELTIQGSPISLCANCRVEIPSGERTYCLECHDNGYRSSDDLRKPTKEPPDPEPPDDPKKAKRVISPVLWEVQLPSGEVLSVQAKTRNEAKAQAKTELGIPEKQGLPKGTVCKRPVDKPKTRLTRKGKVKTNA